MSIPWFLVRTPRELAEFFLGDNGSGVGLDYEDQQDVFDSQGGKEHIVGLLEILVSEARKNRHDWTRAHRSWLRQWRDEIEKLLKEANRETLRVKKLLNGFDGSQDLRWTLDINWFAMTYRKDSLRHAVVYKKLKGLVKRLKSIKKPEDAINLKGVGEKTLEKILLDCGVNNEL